MNKSISLGTLFGLRLSTLPNAIWATGILWAVLAGAGFGLLHLTPFEAVVGGLLAALLHWVGEIWHQLGHAWAARWVGYPMQGVELWWIFGRSLYPSDEPRLPARVHIRRALGGAPASLVLTLIVGAILLGGREMHGVVYGLVGFFFWENLLVFTLGAFLPLGFTDGSTLLRYWGKD
jgi:hypothetical protein